MINGNRASPFALDAGGASTRPTVPKPRDSPFGAPIHLGACIGNNATGEIKLQMIATTVDP
jgi:hypothetical protein